MAPVGPGTARSWVERELSRPEYHESLLQRFLSWLTDQWNGLQAAASDAGPLSSAVVVTLTVLVLALSVVAASRLRREPAAPPSVEAALGTGLVPPQVHRRNAEEALAVGRFEEALVEGFRAIAARATERGVLEERPARTAHELTLELSPVHPDQADDLGRCSELFERILYGGLPATVTDARGVLALDDALRAAGSVASARRLVAASGTVPR